MSGPNHVTGGLVFTGIFCSFWNVNIFASPIDIGLCVFFSLLPDIDHTKSMLGKLFYPIAKFLDRKYGHRTITHSLIAYIGLFIAVSMIKYLWFPSSNIVLIYAFAFLSHLMFDMMTKQGIPLLYPFKRNPCVIPGNPEYRFKSSDLKTESLIFSVFIVLGLTCQPLFAHGFWFTYNTQFNTIKHLNAEKRNSNTLLNVNYSFTRLGREVVGNGLLIASNESEAYLFNNGFTKITTEDNISYLKPTKTLHKLEETELFFFNITADSLQRLLHNKPLLNLKIQSNSKLSYLKDNKYSLGKSLELEYAYNPQITFEEDSTNLSVINKIELLEYELNQEQQQQNFFAQDRRRLNDSITFITHSINSMDNYERERATELLQKLKLKAQSLTQPDDNSDKIRLQLKHLRESNKPNNNGTCNGYISYIIL